MDDVFSKGRGQDGQGHEGLVQHADVGRSQHRRHERQASDGHDGFHDLMGIDVVKRTSHNSKFRVSGK